MAPLSNICLLKTKPLGFCNFSCVDLHISSKSIFFGKKFVIYESVSHIRSCRRSKWTPDLSSTAPETPWDHHFGAVGGSFGEIFGSFCIFQKTIFFVHTVDQSAQKNKGSITFSLKYSGSRLLSQKLPPALLSTTSIPFAASL